MDDMQQMPTKRTDQLPTYNDSIKLIHPETTRRSTYVPKYKPINSSLDPVIPICGPVKNKKIGIHRSILMHGRLGQRRGADLVLHGHLHLLAEDDFGVKPESVDLGDLNNLATPKQPNQPLDIHEIVRRVPIPSPMHGDVKHRDAAGPERALDLGGEPGRVERVVEHVGELEVEAGVGEGLAVEVALEDERRGRREVDPDGVRHADEPERGDLLAQARADAERAGGVGEEVGGLEAGEDGGEGGDLAVPVAGGPDAAEARGERLGELVLEVVVVGAVGGGSPPHPDVWGERDGWEEERGGGGWGGGGGVGVEEEEEEGEDQEEEEEGAAGLGIGAHGDRRWRGVVDGYCGMAVGSEEEEGIGFVC